MDPVSSYTRNGRGSLRPYLFGELELPDLVQHAFGGREIDRVQLGERSYHVEMQVGDSILVLEVGELPAHVQPWTCSVCLYVADVDQAFARALDWGLTSIADPEDKPYGERQAGLRDTAGNTWWVATYTGV